MSCASIRSELREQAGVVERERRAAGQDLGEREVVAAGVAALRVGGEQQRQRAEPAPAGT